MNILSIQNLSYNLDNFILEIEKLHIEYGEKVAILGENGSGKSTFLNIISGYYSTEKKVKIKDKYIEEIDSSYRSKIISYLPQFSDILFNYTVYETVLMGRFPHVKEFDFSENDHNTTNNIIKMFHLEDYKEKLFIKLSGGEKKRVMLARVFNQDSEIILLDEPFASLDVKHSIHLGKIVKELKKTIIIIFHDINFAKEIADRLIFFKNGKIISNINKEDLNNEILFKAFDVEFKCINNYYFVNI